MSLLALEQVWLSVSVQWRAEPLVLDRSRDDGKVLTRNTLLVHNVGFRCTNDIFRSIRHDPAVVMA